MRDERKESVDHFKIWAMQGSITSDIRINNALNVLMRANKSKDMHGGLNTPRFRGHKFVAGVGADDNLGSVLEHNIMHPVLVAQSGCSNDDTLRPSIEEVGDMMIIPNSA